MVCRLIFLKKITLNLGLLIFLPIVGTEVGKGVHDGSTVFIINFSKYGEIIYKQEVEEFRHTSTDRNNSPM